MRHTFDFLQTNGKSACCQFESAADSEQEIEQDCPLPGPGNGPGPGKLPFGRPRPGNERGAASLRRCDGKNSSGDGGGSGDGGCDELSSGAVQDMRIPICRVQSALECEMACSGESRCEAYEWATPAGAPPRCDLYCGNVVAATVCCPAFVMCKAKVYQPPSPARSPSILLSNSPSNSSPDVVLITSTALGSVFALLLLFLLWYCSRARGRGARQKEADVVDGTPRALAGSLTVSTSSANCRDSLTGDGATAQIVTLQMASSSAHSGRLASCSSLDTLDKSSTYLSATAETSASSGMAHAGMNVQKDEAGGLDELFGSSRDWMKRIAGFHQCAQRWREKVRVSQSQTASKLWADPQAEDDIFAEYERMRVLGQGTSGRAVLLRSHKSGDLVVAKELPVGKGPAARKAKQSVELEVNLLAKLAHPNIIAYLGAFYTAEGMLSVVMEYADSGSLAEAIETQYVLQSSFAQSVVRKWVRQMADALQHLHSFKVLHRDLKPANILLSQDNGEHNAKLADFGVSRNMSEQTMLVETVAGTPFYMSPEMLAGRGYAEPADVWALGVVLYELITLHRPFRQSNMGALCISIAHGEVDEAELSTSSYPPQLWGLATNVGMLNPDEGKRVQLCQVLVQLDQLSAAEADGAADGAAEADGIANAQAEAVGLPSVPAIELV
mmetsp:Transcript_31072/g.51513  ORF Transcript_31072/g.51513 Transcript_31072/m.51513 type:complete len:670 (-) Transcript_31072:141-2150(-)